MAEPIDVIFDTDPGKDDAFALFLALAAADRLNVMALTTAAGNLGLETTTAAARRIVEAAGRPEIPVYSGCPAPLLSAHEPLPHLHGHDGLGGSGLPEMARGPEPDHAVAKLIELIDRASAPVTVAAIAPLTNLAVAFTMRPDLAAKLARLVIMGGARSAGNITDHAEFNIHVDPHAAQIVLTAGAPTVLVPLDITRPTLPEPDWFDGLAGFGTLGRAIAGMWRERSMPLHDVIVTAYLLWPDLFALERCRVDVDVDNQETRGRTRIEATSDGSIDVVADIDRDRLYESIESTLRSYK
ncbi:MAG: nucleoside hydrolase [Pseudomonadota bacterium]